MGCPPAPFPWLVILSAVEGPSGRRQPSVPVTEGHCPGHGPLASGGRRSFGCAQVDKPRGGRTSAISHLTSHFPHPASRSLAEGAERDFMVGAIPPSDAGFLVPTHERI